MAPKYGSKESFLEQEALLKGIKGQLTEIVAKEAAVKDGMDALGTSEERAAAARTRSNAVRREATDLSGRATRAAKEEATALDVNTAAIEANRRAREHRAATARQEAIDITRAARGAQDPLLTQAAGIQAGGGGVRQYRQQLGIGYSRARALEDALGAGFRPGSSGATVPTASTGVIQADIDLARAKKDYSSAVKRGALAEAELAQQTVAEAQARKVAAQAAIKAQAARAEADLAIAREEVAAGGPGMALIRHPTMFQGITHEPTGATFRRYDPAVPGGAPTPSPAATGGRQWPAGWSSLQRGAAVDAELAAAAAKEKLNGVTERSVGLLQRESAAHGTVSQAMYKHGALTQEFLIAAGRGEVTLRELGSQALITAGKFGGWTAAATAVFGVVAAFHQVYTGAKEAQSAIEGLARFIPNLDKAQAGRDLESLSRRNNVPIAEAGTAQQGFARVFGNEPSAYIAADTALKAYQLDQISVQDSTRYLTALTQEFGLKAAEIPGVFDQISRSQRVSNARVSEMLPLLARSAAAVKTSGGDLTQLIALGATAQVASGQTGNVVGTAFTRSASNFSTNPANAAIIRSFGVDTTHGFTELLISAVREVHKQNLSGDQVRVLARAIGGPQYGGRVFTTLLGQDKRLERNLEQLTPEKSKGSTDEEFQHRMQQADQMLKQVGIRLQDIGAALVRVGAFNFAGVLLKALTEVLGVTNKLIDIYDKVPDPFKSIITSGLELMVVLRGLQRFGALRGFAGGPLDAISGQDRYTRTRALRGMRDYRDTTRNEADTTQLRATRGTAAAERARLAATADAETVAQAEQRAALAPTSAAARNALAKAQLEFAASTQVASDLQKKASVASHEAAIAASMAASADEEYAATRKMSNRELRASGIWASRELAVPNPHGVEQLHAPGVVVPGRIGPMTQAEAEASHAAQAQTAMTRAERVEAQLTQQYALARTGFGGATGRAADAVATRAISAAGHATETLERTAGKVKGLGSGLGNFARGMGALDIAFLTFFGGQLLTSQVDKLSADLNKSDTFFAGYKESTQRLHDGLVKQERAISGVSVGDQYGDLLGGLNDVLNPTKLPSTLGKELQGNYETPRQKRLRLQQEADQASETSFQRAVVQGNEARRGAPITGLNVDQATRRITHDQELRRQGLISQAQFDAAMKKHGVEIVTLLDADKKDVANARAVYAQAMRSMGSLSGYAASLRNLGDPEVDKELQANQTLYSQDNSKGNLDRLRTVYEEYGKRYGKRAGEGDAVGIQALATARNAYYQSLTQRAQAEQALQQSNTADPEQQGVIAVRFARQAVDRAKRIFKVNSIEYATAVTALHSAEQQRDQAVLTGVQADNALLLARAGSDPLAQATASVQGAKAVLDTLLAQRDKGHRVDPNAIKNARAQLLTSQTQQQTTQRQQDQQVAQLQSQLAQAQAGDPVGAARIGVQAAQKALGSAKGRTETLQAQLDLVNAQKALQDALTQSAQATINLQESLTTDPVQIAHLEVAKARQGLKGKKGVDKTNAQADLNRALQAERDARLSSKEADIDFEQSMGNISIQDAIDRYNALLHTRNLTKQQKRDIQSKVHQLQQQAATEAQGFNLDVGSLKLPTLYDIRKGFDPVRGIINQQRDLARQAHRDGSLANGATGVTHQVNATIQHSDSIAAQIAATVNVYVTDKAAAGEVYAAIDKAMGTHVKARMRSRGRR